MEKKKILIFAKNIDGGTGTFISQLKRMPKVLGYNTEIRMLVLKKPEFRRRDKDENAVYYAEPEKKKDYYDLSLETIASIFKEFVWFKKKTDDYFPDVIVALDTHCCLFTAIYGVLFNKRTITVLTFHNNIGAVTFYKLSRFSRWLLRFLCGVFLNTADYIVSVSRGAANDLQKYFFLRKEVFFIPYGIDQQKIVNLGNKRLEKKDEKFFGKSSQNIISVGRFAPQKDFFTLIKAFARVNKKYPQTNLLLLGDGEEKVKLKLLVKSLGIERAVFFLGWKKNIYPYLKRSSIFALSSNYEGFSYVIAEAMTSGLPVISTNTPFGPSELLDDGKYGMLVPMKNASALGRAILALVSDRKLRKKYGELARKRSLYYPEKTMLTRYKDLIEDASDR